MQSTCNGNPTYRVNRKQNRENSSIWTYAEKKALLKLEYRQTEKKASVDIGQMLSKHFILSPYLLKIHVKEELNGKIHRTLPDLDKNIMHFDYKS